MCTRSGHKQSCSMRSAIISMPQNMMKKVLQRDMKRLSDHRGQPEKCTATERISIVGIDEADVSHAISRKDASRQPMRVHTHYSAVQSFRLPSSCFNKGECLTSRPYFFSPRTRQANPQPKELYGLCACWPGYLGFRGSEKGSGCSANNDTPLHTLFHTKSTAMHRGSIKSSDS